MSNPHVATDNKPVKQQQNVFVVYLWAISYIKPYFPQFLGLLICGIIVTIGELLVPKFIQYFIDILLPTKEITRFYWLLALLGGVLAIVICFKALQNFLQRVLQEKASRDLRYAVFQQLRNLGFSYFEKHPVGESLSLLNTEVAATQELYRNYLPTTIKWALMALGSIIFMVHMNALLSLVIIPSFILYYLVGPYFERKASILAKEAAQARVEVNQKVYESITSLRELRANHAEDWDKEHFILKQDELSRIRIRAHLFAYLRGTARRISYYIGAIFLFIAGAYLVQQNQLTVGNLTGFILYYFNAMYRLTLVVTSLTEQKILMYQVEKLYQLVNLEPEVKEQYTNSGIGKIRGELAFNDVHFSYKVAQPILKGIDLVIHPGERVAIVGASGNGKSTLLKLVARFYDPQKGVISLDNIPLSNYSFAQLRGAIGYVFQETYLFGLSVKENIRFGNPEATDDEVCEAAKAAYAHDFITQLPVGYDTQLGERGVKLSGGQKQRISIARMLIKNPSIILLDEATSALDHISELEVKKALDKLLQGRTTITVAHRLSTIENYDKIVLIEDGRVAEIGTYDELMELKGGFYRLANAKDQQRDTKDITR